MTPGLLRTRRAPPCSLYSSGPRTSLPPHPQSSTLRSALLIVAPAPAPAPAPAGLHLRFCLYTSRTAFSPLERDPLVHHRPVLPALQPHRNLYPAAARPPPSHRPRLRPHAGSLARCTVLSRTRPFEYPIVNMLIRDQQNRAEPRRRPPPGFNVERHCTPSQE